eukprot:201924_1
MSSIPFPFEPYEEQKKLMHTIYTTLDEGGIALLESPTGTGKSLSIICSSLHWLLNYNQHHAPSTSTKDATPDWVQQFFEKQQKQQQQERMEQKRKVLLDQQKHLYDNKPTNKRQKLNYSSKSDDPYLINDTNQDNKPQNASDWMKLFDQGLTTPNQHKESQEIEYRKPQIIYCSRTHSQLLQFVNEIKKTKFNDDGLEILTLGSRKQLCIHPKISQYKSTSRMNDACLNLKDTKANKQIKNSIKTLDKRIKIGSKRDYKTMEMDEMEEKGGCPYLTGKELGELSLQITAKIQDIEECHDLGQHMMICPYYAIRKNIHSAHLIAMPYTSLIHEKTRTSLGIEVKDNVIIIDEAHNLIENINQIHSVQITLLTLQMSYNQLHQYKTKYINRLKHSNVTKIKTILKVLTAFTSYLSTPHDIKGAREEESDVFVVSVDDVLFDLKIDHINFYDLMEYIEKAELVRKLHGFIDKQYLEQMKQQQKEKKKRAQDNKNRKSYQNVSVTHSPLSFVLNIFESFANMNGDGKLMVTKYRNHEFVSKNNLKFVMLNPYVHFEQIVSECRALILCGGTMQPISHFIQQLFPSKCITKTVRTLSCNHVVSAERVLALSIPCGPCKKKFDFTFKHRFDMDMIQDLGRSVVNFSKITRGGIVIFFPSFKYLEFVLNVWKKHSSDIHRRLQQHKKVLREPESSTEVDAVLEAYNDAIYPKTKSESKCNGGVLLCVVGGKMSEGINFKDDLARVVMMVGLPYPNPHDIELKERMRYLNENVDKNAGSIYYQNLCMRAVNQSIGRAIRHKLDWGAIVLMDYRYVERQNIYQSIPDWIKRSYKSCSNFQKGFQSFCKFIHTMKKT